MSIKFLDGQTASREIAGDINAPRNARDFSGLQLRQADLAERRPVQSRKCLCQYRRLRMCSPVCLPCSISHFVRLVALKEIGRRPSGHGGRAPTRRPPKPPPRSSRPLPRGDRHPARNQSAFAERIPTGLGKRLLAPMPHHAWQSRINGLSAVGEEPRRQKSAQSSQRISLTD